MGELKRKTFEFSSGREIKLHGNSLFISKAYEIGEGLIPNIYALFEDKENDKPLTTIINPYRLSAEELMEIADYSIRLWMDFKESLRRHGVASPKVFNRDDIKKSNGDKSDDSPKKVKNKASQPKEKDNGKSDTSGKEKGNKATNSDEEKSSKEGITEETK